MSCKRFIKKLHLYAPGELSAGERKRLEKHLLRCDRCSELKRQIEKAGHIIELVRTASPKIQEPEKLTRTIMDRIAAERYERASVLDRAVDMLQVLFFPKTRPALVAMILFIVIGFFIQESMNMYRISQLEKKVAYQSMHTATTQFDRYMQELDSRDVEQIKAVFREENVLDVSDEWILIRRQSLDALLHSYNRFLQENTQLLEEVRQKDPDLMRVFEKSNFSTLFERKEEIKRYIDKL